MSVLRVWPDSSVDSPFEHVIPDMLPRSVSVPNWAVAIPHRKKDAKEIEVRMLIGFLGKD